LLHINVCSLNKHFERLEELLEDLDEKPEFIAISETKLHSNFNSYLPGYTFLQANFKTNAGGVGLFVKETLNIKTLNDYNLNVNDCEEIWVKVQLNNSEKIFSVIYKHPGSSFKRFSYGHGMHY